VLPHIVGENRDPKVFWYAPDKTWIMALYLDRNDFAIFSSPDLKKWERLDQVTIPGTSECPEFFEIAVDGNAQRTRWVFYGGNGRYLVGSFDGKKFKTESGPHSLHHGNCWYASQTYNDLPAADGRRILVPWGQMSTPGMPFNQMMGVPVQLTLNSTPDGLRLFAYPVKELAALRIQSHVIGPQPLVAETNPLARIRGELFDLEAELAVGDASEIRFDLRGVPVVYDVKKQSLSCQSKQAALKPIGGKIQLRLLVDRTSIDIFGNQGSLYMPMGVIVPQENRSLGVAATGPGAQLLSAQVHELKSAW
jgi:sucrose-6-phosphate hydrolase SacC (GH32 family)